MNDAELSILIVSYNTRELTRACLASLRSDPVAAGAEVIVVDNGSEDGSAEMIEREFPGCTLLRPNRNLGFAAANNLAASRASGRRLLLLNPDAQVRDSAVERLWRFADARPAHGIWGGRTVFADGSLNPSSCWGRPTPWSMFCRGTGLAALGGRIGSFDTEGMPGWRRDSEREVDIVSGCFLLIDRTLWDRLGGFDPRFFMYAEDADLCMRARAFGARPIICPEASIVHHGGASERVHADKLVRLLTARCALVERHWAKGLRTYGKAMHGAWVAHRAIGWRVLKHTRGTERDERRSAALSEAWRRRREWWGSASGHDESVTPTSAMEARA